MCDPHPNPLPQGGKREKERPFFRPPLPLAGEGWGEGLEVPRFARAVTLSQRKREQILLACMSAKIILDESAKPPIIPLTHYL